MDVFAVELQVAVAHQRAGQHPGLGQHLEAVADAEDPAAVRGELLDSLHDGTEPRDRAAAQVIAVTESPGHHHGIRSAQGVFLVPDITGGVAQEPDRMDRVLVAVRGGKLEHGKVHSISSL